MIRPIHPFPARMAPDIALNQLKLVAPGATILDPMAGSGTVLRQATHTGHMAIGFDMDPLAVLMSRVWTTKIDLNMAFDALEDVMKRVLDTRSADVVLDNIDGDVKTDSFVKFWFDIPQRTDLRRVTYVLNKLSETNAALADLYRVAMSRIIITKSKGASLARDVSHSRPHKSWDTSDFEVVPAFERSAKRVIHLLKQHPPEGRAMVSRGDARNLAEVAADSIDMVLTSPPYLNAIDYMRGHRMSLVWLGHKVGELSSIRSSNIGAERAPDVKEAPEEVTAVMRAMCAEGSLPRAKMRMVERYAGDLLGMMAEVSRVLKSSGQAVMVVGNSTLQGTFVENSAGVKKAAETNGLRLACPPQVRELPNQHRYLPMPIGDCLAPLSKRMRSETILTFAA